MVTLAFSGAIRAQKRRARERGAAVFVVVMAITLLTAIGLFAAHSATLVDQAAGYERLARQTQELADYGTLTAAAELGSGVAQPYLEQMESRQQVCTANADPNGNPGMPCYKLTYLQLTTRTKEISNESLIKDYTGNVENVIGSGDAQGDFVVELTEPTELGVPVAGTDLSGTGGMAFRYVRVTATSIAQYRPAGSTTCSNSIATMTGQQTVRARLVVGPVQH